MKSIETYGKRADDMNNSQITNDAESDVEVCVVDEEEANHNEDMEENSRRSTETEPEENEKSDSVNMPKTFFKQIIYPSPVNLVKYVWNMCKNPSALLPRVHSM